MKYNSVLFLVLAGVWIAHKTKARSLKEPEFPLKKFEGNTFPYTHAVNEPRRSSHHHRYSQKSNPTTTTPRPFVSYWNQLRQNIVRNVRVPVPMITWNITNPLANLFNIEDQQELEFPTQQHDYSYHTRDQLRQKTKRRRPNKRHRKHKKPVTQVMQDHLQEGHHHYQQQEFEDDQIILPQYPINDKISETSGPMYFYDPNTDSYYAVQKVKAMGSYIEGVPYNPRLITDNPQEIKDDAVMEDETEENPASVENMENEVDVEAENDLKSVETEDNNKATTNENLPQAEEDQEENLRNVLGSFMRDDSYNRQKQSTKPKKSYNSKNQILKSKPRQQLNYYFLLDVNSK